MRAKNASDVDLVTPFTRPLSVSCLSAVNFKRVNKTDHIARDGVPGCRTRDYQSTVSLPSSFHGSRQMALSQAITVDSDKTMQLKLRNKTSLTAGVICL